MTPLPRLDIINGDRRAYRRYALALDLEYKITRGKRVLAAGNGRTCDMSKRGIAFTCEGVPIGGISAELSIDWPITLDTRTLKLVVAGRILRADGARLVLIITRHEFRINGNRDLVRAARALSMGMFESPAAR